MTPISFMRLFVLRATIMGVALFAQLATASVEEQQPGSDSLDHVFSNPPSSARPETWWHWMNGNITPEGISRDMEAMAQVGLGGAHIFNVGRDVPEGSVAFMSSEWLDLVQHAAKEAQRHGLDLTLHNCAGWSGSGGPWVKPEDSMQTVVWSECRFTGPAKIQAQLPKAQTWLDFHRDIAVLAFPTPALESVQMHMLKPKVTTSTNVADEQLVADGLLGTHLALPHPTADRPEWIQLEFAEPYTARSFVMWSGPGRNIHQGELQVSEDGRSFRRITNFTIPHVGMIQSVCDRTFEPVTGRYFRVLFTKADRGTNEMTIAEVEFSNGLRLADAARKAGYTYPGRLPPEVGGTDLPEDAITQSSMIDLTAQMDSNGSLTWDVPAGEWTVLRFAHTPTGVTNRPSPDSGVGLECDKMSSEAVDAFWQGGIAPVLDKLGSLKGTVLRQILIDSWEVGYQNWTPRFQKEFLKRRGYNMRPWLPTMTGRVVESTEATERFLWDLRQTISELIADNYYGRFRELCRENGLSLGAEPYGMGNLDPFASAAAVDIPMGEFWVGSQEHSRGNKLAASVAHTSGKRIVAAESFTHGSDVPAWSRHPFLLKSTGDQAFAQGINRLVMHRYTHQPWENFVPGMTLGSAGIQFERTVTWWQQSRAWIEYITRCQTLLQEGQFVADLLYLVGDGAPNDMPPRGQLKPVAPLGFDYDACNADTVIEQLKVKDGMLVLPGGMSYRVLVLPESKVMTPRLLRKVEALVESGATVIGPRPDRSPSLEDYPACDDEVRKLAARVWGDCDGTNITEHTNGKGRVIWGQSIETVMKSLSVSPDFQFTSEDQQARINWLHRTAKGADFYFLANPTDADLSITARFRSNGRQPEIWHPDSGLIESCALWHEVEGLTEVPIRFGPADSLFVVFRNPSQAAPLLSVSMNGELIENLQGRDLAKASPVDLSQKSRQSLTATFHVNGAYELRTGGGKKVTANVKDLPPPLAIEAPWRVSFPPNSGAPESVVFDRLASWVKRDELGIRFFSGTATYQSTIDIPADWVRESHRINLDLGRVCVIAEVSFNGRDMGILWKPPFRMDVTEAVKPGTNTLQIRIVNLWPNRIIGDEQLPSDCDWDTPSIHGGSPLKEWPDWLLAGRASPTGRHAAASWKFYSKDSPLLESGLIGPVKLQLAEQRTIELPSSSEP